MCDAQFISEAIRPLPGVFDTEAMVRGAPGLPEGFVWRGRRHEVVRCLASGKELSSSAGDRYVRRHTFSILMDDGSRWEVYFLRQPPARGRRSRRSPRWFLKTRRA